MTETKIVPCSGNVTNELIAKYIKEQDVQPEGDVDFKMTE